MLNTYFKRNKTYVIGVCGPSCGGKTTVCKEIQNKIISTLKNNNNDNNIICVISQDSYYNGGNPNTNYDVPESIDFDLLIEHIKDLIDGKEINVPIYDFTSHNRKEESNKCVPTKIIIVEGILIFSNEKLRELCDLKVFVEANEILCYTRRLRRDTQERGRTFDEVEKRYLEHVVPSSKKYVYPSRDYADISLINNTHGQFIGLEIFLDHIEKKINQCK